MKRVRFSRGSVAILQLVSMIVAIVGVVAAATLGVLLLTGKIAIVTPVSEVTTNQACSLELISQYNNLQKITDSDELAQQYEDMSDRIEKVYKKGDADPTCVFIKYSIASARGEEDTVLEAHYNTLERLAKDGLYASSALYDIMSVRDIGLSLGKITLPEDELATDGAG